MFMGVAFLLLAAITNASAQHVRSRVDVNTLTPDALRAYRTWEAFLGTRIGKFSSVAGMPSALWSAAEQRRWPIYELAGFSLRDDAVPEILAIDPVGDSFRITTAFRVSAPPPVPWWTDVTMTVYAEREGGTWKLANALVPNTQRWRRDTVGAITYVYAPDCPYNHARARRAVAFTDSLALAFGAPSLAPLTHFLLLDVDAVYRVLGLESTLSFGATGGLAQPVNR